MSAGYLLEGMSPELRQRMKDRLAVPEIKQAMTFWVMQAVNQLGMVRSEKQIVGYLLEKLAPHGCTIEEARYVYKVAANEFAKTQKLMQEVNSGGNSRIVQN